MHWYTLEPQKQQTAPTKLSECRLSLSESVVSLGVEGSSLTQCSVPLLCQTIVLGKEVCKGPCSAPSPGFVPESCSTPRKPLSTQHDAPSLPLVAVTESHGQVTAQNFHNTDHRRWLFYITDTVLGILPDVSPSGMSNLSGKVNPKRSESSTKREKSNLNFFLLKRSSFSGFILSFWELCLSFTRPINQAFLYLSQAFKNCSFNGLSLKGQCQAFITKKV